MMNFQLALFGKTSWERFHQVTGWILEPCLSCSQQPIFQYLLLEDGQMPIWWEGDALTSLGGYWMPSTMKPGGANADLILQENAG